MGSATLFGLGLVASWTVANAASTAPSSLPQVDFSKMGTVGVGGSYDGLDFYSPGGTQFSTNGDTLFEQGKDGQVTVLGSTGDGGRVRAVCWDGGQRLFVAGTFTSFNSTQAANILSYDMEAKTFGAMGAGLDGPVSALYCDGGNGQVWAGGDFTGPSGGSGYKGGVAVWSTSASSWTPAPFGGLNGTVTSISPNSAGSSVIFGGDFTTIFHSNTSSQFNSSQTTNTTRSSNTSAPPGTTVTGLSGYLTPLSLNNATVTAGPASTRSGYSDATALLCPGGTDGSSNSWLARDGSEAKINVLAYKSLKATGIRMGNTFVEGRGTTGFRIISIPDNTLLTLSYNDPVTGANSTCSQNCPLSTDPSIAAQDFLFRDGARDLTGYQVILSSWKGAGAGLHRLQLLSDGAYASASTSGNEGACATSSGSSVQTTGNWEPCTVPTTISGTTADVLYANIPINDVTYPSVTFYPYIASSGIYDVYLVTPGCNRLLDCDGRTSVDVEVFPTDGGLGWTSTISQKVKDDTSSLIYSGYMEATSGNFSSTVILSLAAQPEKVDGGSTYVIVADQVLLSLVGVNGTLANGTMTNSSTITNSSAFTNSSRSVAFGVFEWARSSQGVDATSTSPGMDNSTETAVTVLGYSLESINASSVNAVVVFDSTTFVAGNFTSGNYSNVVAVDDSKNVLSLDGGLDGPVYAAARLGNYVYFGGNFTKMAKGDTAMQRFARYDPTAKAWAALGSLDGPVIAIVPSKISTTQLVLVGNFTAVTSTNGTMSKTGGRAVWDTAASAWVSSGLVFGSVAAIAAGDDATFMAGRVRGYAGMAANGFATLSSSGGSATINSLDLNFSEQGSGASAPSASAAKRSIHGKQRASSNWLAVVSDIITKRAGSLSHRSLEQRAIAPTMTQATSPAPAVLAGAYYSNSSASGTPDITILGGNFTTDDGYSAVAFYQQGQGIVGAPAGVQGVVRALAVYQDTLFVGGSDVEVPNVASGLLLCSLNNGQWVEGKTPSLNAAQGSNVVINAIRNRMDTSTIIVAGSFATAGSLSCPGICIWDQSSAQWTSLAGGLTGEVRAIDFAGSNHDSLIAAGSFVLDGAVAYVAQYSFANNSWRTLGDLAGPATAVAVDDNNVNNIFVTGYSTNGNAPYLAQWDGSRWNAQNASLQSGSSISQLAFVPMSNEHSASGAIEKDRMLMVSGALSLASGNASTALYDGAQLYPYLVASSESGGQASAGGFFWSQQSFSFAVRRYLAKGIIVLIAIAIATGLVFLLVLLGILLAFCLRKRDDRNYPTTAEKDEDADNHVFHNVQTAVERSFAPAAVAGVAAHKQRPSDESQYTLGDEAIMAGDDEYEGRETIMRYDFEGDQEQPGELTVSAGEQIIVIDDVQSPEWSYVRVVRDGREGVVPSSYIW